MRISRFLIVTMALLGLARTANCQTTRPATSTESVIGYLIRVDGDNLIVRPLHKKGDMKDISVPTSAETLFFLNNHAAALFDLRPEMTVDIRWEAREPNTPPHLWVMAGSKGIRGIVRQVDGLKVTVETKQADGQVNPVVVVTDKNTRIIFPGYFVARRNHPPRDGTLDDLGEGTIVRAVPETGTATEIFIYSPSTTLPSWYKPE